MKFVAKITCLLLAVAGLLFLSEAPASLAIAEGKSRFLTVDELYEDTPDGVWVESSGTRTNDKVYVNQTVAEYNQIDLTKFSTEDLVVFLLNNRRAMSTMLHFSKTATPYEEAKVYYHGLIDLEKREDAKETLLNALATLKNATPNNDSERILFSMRIKFLEAVLSSDFYRTQLSVKELEMLINSSLAQKNEQEDRNSDTLMISYGFYYDYAGEMIMRGGTELALYSARADYSTASKNAIRNELCLAHPQAILMGDATSVYNGYSYALYRQSISNNRCIFDISAALNDPHFVISAYGNWDDCNTGDIIVYKDRAGNVLHAGVIYNTNDEGVYVVSKWEDLCLFGWI